MSTLNINRTSKSMFLNNRIHEYAKFFNLKVNNTVFTIEELMELLYVDNTSNRRQNVENRLNKFYKWHRHNKGNYVLEETIGTEFDFIFYCYLGKDDRSNKEHYDAFWRMINNTDDAITEITRHDFNTATIKERCSLMNGFFNFNIGKYEMTNILNAFKECGLYTETGNKRETITTSLGERVFADRVDEEVRVGDFTSGTAEPCEAGRKVVDVLKEIRKACYEIWNSKAERSEMFAALREYKKMAFSRFGFISYFTKEYEVFRIFDVNDFAFAFR